MSKQESRKKYWAFTCNNYTDQDIEKFTALYPKTCSYVFFGKEVSPSTGTPHLQGFLVLVNKARLSRLKEICPTSHWEPCVASALKNKKYCEKSGDVVEVGSLSTEQGQRNDLTDLMKSVKEGNLCMKRLREEFPEVCAKYPRFVCEYIQDNVPLPQVVPFPLRDWQQELNASLNLPPDERKIKFVVDYKGNQGKTWFAKYYCTLHPENTQYMEASKKTDMSYALDPSIRVLFVNCTRKMVDFLPYGFLESVKDGIVFSTKYESRNKILGPCHVVVLMNQDPDMSALSDDRYDIMNL